MCSDHAPLDAAVDRRVLVLRQVVAELGADEDEELAELLLDAEGRLAARSTGRSADAFGDARQLVADLLRRQAEVRRPARERAPRHAVVLRGRRVLHERDAAGGLDRLEAEASRPCRFPTVRRRSRSVPDRRASERKR